LIPYSFHPDAEAEFEHAASFYESRMEGLGRSFTAEIERAISLIRERPDVGSPVWLTCRRVLVHRFPYSIIYKHDAGSVLIFTIAHQRRRPESRQRRT
jgi:plasmid stabilization system protein ParE